MDRKYLWAASEKIKGPEGPETDSNRRSFIEMILFIFTTWDLVRFNQKYWTVLKAKWQSCHN